MADGYAYYTDVYSGGLHISDLAPSTTAYVGFGGAETVAAGGLNYSGYIASGGNEYVYGEDEYTDDEWNQYV